MLVLALSALALTAPFTLSPLSPPGPSVLQQPLFSRTLFACVRENSPALTVSGSHFSATVDIMRCVCASLSLP